MGSLLPERVESLAANERVAVVNRVLISLAHGETEEAFSLLKSAAEDKEPYEAPEVVTRIKANVFEDPVLERPEFVELRERLGFTDL